MKRGPTLPWWMPVQHHKRKREAPKPQATAALTQSFPLAMLEPQLLKILDSTTFQHEGVPWSEADGVLFLCPKCFQTQGNTSVGTHSCICWRPHVPQTWTPRPGRWDFEGSSLEDITLVAGSSSILLKGGCGAHFYIRSGRIEDLT